MAEKLKSALKIIHWSLAFKALIAGLAWVYFPWWISVFVLLGIYFVPLFQTRHLFMPFIMSLILGWILPASFFSGILIPTSAAVNLLILLIFVFKVVPKRICSNPSYTPKAGEAV